MLPLNVDSFESEDFMSSSIEDSFAVSFSPLAFS